MEDYPARDHHHAGDQDHVVVEGGGSVHCGHGQWGAGARGGAGGGEGACTIVISIIGAPSFFYICVIN